MKALVRIASVLVGVFGFYCGWQFAEAMKPVNHAKEAKETKEIKPLTDWKKFYDYVKDDKPIQIRMGAKYDNGNNSEFAFFLVDGKRWYTIGYGSFRGCGFEQDVYYTIHDCSRLKQDLVGVPGPNARFVVVGPGMPEIVDIEIRYKEEE